MLTAREFEEIYKAQKLQMQRNTQAALSNESLLVRDESKALLEGGFRGFSFFGESSDEREVKN